MAVAVQIDTARRLKRPMAFNQSYCHIGHIGRFVFGSARFYRFNDGVDGRVIVLNLHFPSGMDVVVPSPNVADPRFATPFVMGRSVRLRQRQFLGKLGVADRRPRIADKGFVSRKRRVNGNQVNAFVIEAA